jgi:hypothetical protein
MRLVLLLTVLFGGCVVRSSTSVGVDQVGSRLAKDRHGDLRLISPTGQRTPWVRARDVVMTPDALCVKQGAPWQYVTAIEVAALTDSNIAAILVDLPREIRVRHRGGGVIELETNGRDLARWLGSSAHDPADVVARYRVRGWGEWDGPMTWRDLASAASPLVGWPTAGATAELRKVSVGGSIALSLIALPFAVIAVGGVMLANAPSPLPGEDPPELSFEPTNTDQLLAAGDAVEAGGDAAGTWRPTRCRPVW